MKLPFSLKWLIWFCCKSAVKEVTLFTLSLVSEIFANSYTCDFWTHLKFLFSPSQISKKDYGVRKDDDDTMPSRMPSSSFSPFVTITSFNDIYPTRIERKWKDYSHPKQTTWFVFISQDVKKTELILEDENERNFQSFLHTL